MAKTYKSTRKSPYKTQIDDYVSVALEPKAFYGKAISTQNYLQLVLGTDKSLSNEMDYVLLTRKGLKKNTVTYVASKLGVTQEKMSNLLHMSSRTFQRLKDSEPLDIYTSEQTIEMVQVLARCNEVFEDEEASKEWLNSPLGALGKVAPVDLLDTSFGVKMVLDVLGRIEQGVYS